MLPQLLVMAQVNAEPLGKVSAGLTMSIEVVAPEMWSLSTSMPPSGPPTRRHW